jgi:phosphate transport system substrate-binding protein
MRGIRGGVRLLWMGIALLGASGSYAQSAITLVVTGSSMPEPLYKAWGEAYQKENPTVKLRYLGVGTAESARDVLRGSGDFGGGDAPIPAKQLGESKGEILQLPAALIAIVVVYHLPQTPGDLRLNGQVLGDIYLGKIKNWNDAAIAKLNPGMKLPVIPIQVCHRTGGKGSNYIFSDFLAKTNAAFQAKVGRGDSPNWPVGQSFQQSQELSDKVAGTAGAIGYTELNLAERAGLRTALIQNAAGEFVRPSKKSIEQAALAGSAKAQGNAKSSLTNAPGKESYPISSYTWVYVPAVAKEPQRGLAVAGFLKWVYGPGQMVAGELGYATLPREILSGAAAKAAGVK